MALSSEECNLGQIDLEAVQNEVEKATEQRKKRGAYFVYSPEERFSIAKYAIENRTSRAVHHFKRKYPLLNKNAALTLEAKYEREKKAARIAKRQPLQKIYSQPRGRPTMLRPIDEMVQSYLKVCILYIISFFILKMHDSVGRFQFKQIV